MSLLNIYLQWILIKAVAWAAGMIIRQFLFGAGSLYASQTAVGASLGITIGIAQVFALPAYYRHPHVWIITSLIGWTLGWAIGWNLGWRLFGFAGLSSVYGLIGVVVGFLLGIGQWPLLRAHSSRAPWWIVANVVGWALGLIVGITIGGSFGWILIGGLGGTFTGLGLIWILQPAINQNTLESG